MPKFMHFTTNLKKRFQYLRQLNFDTAETIKPEEFKKNKIFDRIRENTTFKQWL